MQEISTTTKSLPQTLEEKTKYVLFGTEALNIYRAKLRAMEKAGISKEQYEQLKMEAQETAENLLLFSADIGKEMSKIEQTKGNRYSLPSMSGSTKSQAIHNMGFTDRQARDFQTLAKHPEVINKAIEDARAEGKIVTRQDVFHKIAAECYPNKTQEAAQKLREAKKHHEEYMDSKADGIINFEDAVQDKSATKLIFEDFEHRISGIHTETLRIGSLISRDKVKDILRGADNKGLSHILEMAQEIHKQTVRLMREIAEVQDEK